MFEAKCTRGSAALPGVIDVNGYLKGLPTGDNCLASGGETVTFVACGDMGPVRNLESIAARGESAQILGEMKPVLKEADFVFANIEANFSKRGTPLNRAPVFRLDPIAFDLVRQSNVKSTLC